MTLSPRASRGQRGKPAKPDKPGKPPDGGSPEDPSTSGGETLPYPPSLHSDSVVLQSSDILLSSDWPVKRVRWGWVALGLLSLALLGWIVWRSRL